LQGSRRIPVYPRADTVAPVTGTGRIQLLSILTGIIIAAGAGFIGVKKKKTCGRATAATFAPCVIFDLPLKGDYSVPCRHRCVPLPCSTCRDACRCVADDTGELQHKTGLPGFGLMTPAASGRRHSRATGPRDY